MAAFRLNRLRQHLVFRQTDDADGVSPFAQGFGQRRVMCRRPGAYRQQTAAGIKQNSFVSLHEHGMVTAQVAGEGSHVAAAEMHLQTRVLRFDGQGHGLGTRLAVALQCMHQRHELQSDMAVRVVGNRCVEKRTTVQTFLGMRGKAAAQASTAAIGQQSADA